MLTLSLAIEAALGLILPYLPILLIVRCGLFGRIVSALIRQRRAAFHR